MKDIAWTLMLAVVLLLAVSASRHGLVETRVKKQQVVNLRTAVAATATNKQAKEFRLPLKSKAGQNTGEKHKPMVLTVQKHGAVGSGDRHPGAGATDKSVTSGSVREQRHQAMVQSFMAQVTPENLKRFKQEHGEKPLSSWNGDNGTPDNSDEVDPSEIYQHLQGIMGAM